MKTGNHMSCDCHLHKRGTLSRLHQSHKHALIGEFLNWYVMSMAIVMSWEKRIIFFSKCIVGSRDQFPWRWARSESKPNNKRNKHNRINWYSKNRYAMLGQSVRPCPSMCIGLLKRKMKYRNEPKDSLQRTMTYYDALQRTTTKFARL